MSNLRWVTRNGERVLQTVVGGLDWVDVPTHQEPKKVSAHEQLVIDLANEVAERNQSGICFRGEAEIAIEFFKARMPGKYPCQNPPDSWGMSSAFKTGYDQALLDVRKALFGES